MSLGPKIMRTGAALTRAIDLQEVSAAFLDSAFHNVASCHDRALAVDLEGGVINSLQGCADLLTAMQTANFATPEALALVGCFLEILGEFVSDLEGTTPAPARSAGAVVLPFRPPGGDAA